MDKTTKIILAVIIILLVVVIVWQGVKAFSNPEGKVTSNEPIKIGLSAPLTGEAASFGESLSGGAELAVMEINEAGGVNGRMLELVIEDDMCGSEGAQTFSKMVNIDQVTAIVGPLCSAAAGPGVPIAQQAGVPSIIVASAPHLTFTGDYIFRNYPSDSFQGKFAAEFMYNDLGKRKVAIIYVKNDWGEGIMKVFKQRFQELGGQVVFNEGLGQETKDARSTITKLMVNEFDSVYLPLYPATGIATIKQLKEMGANVPFVGGDALAADEVVRSNEAEGVIYTSAKVSSPEEFVNRIKERTGKTADIYAGFVYDGVKILAKAMEKAGTNQEAIKNKLNNIVFDQATALPVMEFDQNGDLKAADFNVMVIENGKAVEYQQ